MAAVEKNMTTDYDEEEPEVEERQELVTNADGTVTIKTIKTTTQYVEVDEDEDGEDEIIEEEVILTTKSGEEDKFGPDGLGQLTQEEMEEFMMLQAERKWLDNMGGGGVGEDEGKKKKKKKSEGGEKKGKKKRKKGEGKENNKRDSLAPRDLLAKHVGPRIRSFDSAKMKSRFEKTKEPMQVSSNCRACDKQVFQMEKIVAEKASWHKSCFKCTECNKTLTLETYHSHEGTLYCKPHFKELFRPKAVVEDEAAARKERTTSKPDYGLDELTTCNVKERFSMFEAAGQEDEEKKLEPIAVRRSQSMISRAARFLQEQESGEEREDYGVSNVVLGEYDEEEEEEDSEEDEDIEEEGVDEDGEPIVIKTTRKKKRTRPHAKDLKNVFEKQHRRDEMSKMRKEELGRFRQMLCAGKNLSLKERFESGDFGNDEDKSGDKEEIKIDEKRAAKSLKAKFERGQPFTTDEEGEMNGNEKQGSEIQEVEEIFKDAETANRARNMFKQIDSKVNEDGSAVLMRSQSFANTPGHRDNRKSMDGIVSEDVELGRDPNLIKSTDNYQDDVDCRNTKSILNMFKKMEAKNCLGEEESEDEEGPRPLHCFTPPPEGEGEFGDSDEYSEDEEYSEEEYSDEDEDDNEGEFKGENGGQYKDEVLQMSAKKAASLRAKFEKWEVEEARQNGINKSSSNGGIVPPGDEEAMPSLDTARNLKAMFEEKAQEAAKPVVKERTKVNRFVGGGGDKCVTCGKTVYVMEKFEVQGKVIHKTCFKCSKCNSPLSMVTFSMGGGKLFCNSHYKQLFTEKGNYDQILCGTLPSTNAQQ